VAARCRPRTHACIFAGAVLLLLAWKGVAGEGPAVDRGAQAQADAEAKGILQKLLDSGRLELSTRPSGAAERFAFSCKLEAVGENAALATRMFSVVRDGERAALVSWPGEAKGGLPSCYSTNGLMVAVDPVEPGGLILLPGGQPAVTVTHDGEALRVQFGHDNRTPEESVLLDVAPILKRAMTKARRFSYDATTEEVQVDIDGMCFIVLVPTDPARQTVLGFEELALGTKEFHMWVKVESTAELKRDYFAVTAESVRKLGLPVRTPEKESDLKRLWLTPMDFRRDLRLRDAAEKLQSLFPLKEKAKGKPAETR
jgi:hypothetical protein